MGVLGEIRRIKQNYCWRKRNKNNNTSIGWPTRYEQIKVGNHTYGVLNVLNEGIDYSLRIGSFCSIAPEVVFVVDSDHRTDYFSTFPYKFWITGRGEKESISKGDIEIADDVWLGVRSTILSGVRIGQGAIIAAGALVSSDVPPYSIVGGVPAKVIKYRFLPDVIDFLLTLDYSALTEDLIMKYKSEIYTKIDKLELGDVEKMFAWFPKKRI